MAKGGFPRMPGGGNMSIAYGTFNFDNCYIEGGKVKAYGGNIYNVGTFTMADGTITADEYDLLYQGICTDYGVLDAMDGYWEYGMTITSPCYYVSYSVSAISVLQLYEVAQTDGFDVAKEQYLKLFTYVDEDPEMGMQDILKYAGMLSFKDEQLYVDLSAYFARK